MQEGKGGVRMSRIGALKEIDEICRRINLSDSKPMLFSVLVTIQEIVAEEVGKAEKKVVK